MTKRDADDAVRRLATRQHGLFTRRQARACGIDRFGVARRLASGAWMLLTQRVFRLAGLPDHSRLALLAAVLDAGGGAVASGRSAAALVGLPGFELRRPEVSVPRLGRHVPTGLAQVHERVTLRPEHGMLVHGIPSTILPITLLDVAAQCSPARAERAVDYALSRRLVSTRRLRAVLDEPGGQGRAGTALLRAIVDARAEVAYPPTGLELRVLDIIRRAGLPLPRPQVDVGDDAWIGRVDFRWDTRPPVVLEVDSGLYHTSVLDREADAARDERLRAAGHVVGRVTELQVWHRPDEVARSVARLLRARHPAEVA